MNSAISLHNITQDMLNQIRMVLSNIYDLDKVRNTLTKIVKDVLDLEQVNIYIFTKEDKNTILHEDVKLQESQFCIPLVSQDKLVGVLVFKSNNKIDSAGLRFISDFADLLAAFISIILNIQRQVSESAIQQYFINSIRSGVISINCEKIIISFNKHAENILGANAREVCGKSIEILPQEIANRLQLAIEKGIVKDKEDLYLISHNIPINVSTSTILGKDGQVLGATILFSDLRERYNQGYFKEILRDEIRRAKRYGHQFNIVFVHIQDMADVSHYNIEIINKLCSYVNKIIRESDRAVRYSGNEIAILLPETPYNGALTFVQRFTKGLQKESFFGKMRISIGIACYPLDGTTSEDLIQTAVTSFYKSMTDSSSIVKTAFSTK